MENGSFYGFAVQQREDAWAVIRSAQFYSPWRFFYISLDWLREDPWKGMMFFLRHCDTTTWRLFLRFKGPLVSLWFGNAEFY